MTDSAFQKRRYLALWFPFLTTDRLHRSLMRSGARPDERPVVVTAHEKGAPRIVAADRKALSLGLGKGLALADARARVPDIAVHESDGAADSKLIGDIGAWCERYTPFVAEAAGDGLFLEIGGSVHLFGGEAAILTDIAERLERFGMTTHAAIARTPDCARAIARFGKGGIVARGEEKNAVAPLPVTALEIDADIVLALKRAGLKTIGDLAERPRKPLAARFGADFLTRLSGICGQSVRPLEPRRPLPHFTCEQRFADPIGLSEDIEAALDALSRQLCMLLERKDMGSRAFEAVFYRADGATRRIEALSGRPLRAAEAVRKLFLMRLDGLADPLDPGFGFDAIRLSVVRSETEGQSQPHLERETAKDEEIADLIGRLTARFGADTVERFTPLNSYIPERAVRRQPAISSSPQAVSWPAPEAGEPPKRPILLFTPPQPVETVAEVPDGPPYRFRWRRVLHEIVHAEGPERLAPEWWRGEPEQLSRDYYRVEDSDGYRFWLFRHGVYGRETGDAIWYIHGLFA